MVRFPNSASQRGQDRFAAGGSGYDPSSRYDPTTMGRIADTDLDPHLDPDEELFDHAKHSLDINPVGFLGRGNGGGSRNGRPNGGGTGSGGSGWGQNILCLPTLPAPDSRQVRRLIMFTLTAAAVIGASLAITHTVQTNSSGSGTRSSGGSSSVSSSSSSSGGGGLSGAYTSPPNPPSDLAKSICTVEAIAQPGGYAKCQAQCTQADCCFLPAHHWFSCAEGSDKICDKYRSACAVLDEYDSSTSGNNGSVDALQRGQEKEIPPAPDGLADICATSNLYTLDGYNACAESCSPSRCCTETIEQCKVINPDVCAEYQPCSMLSDVDAPALPRPSGFSLTGDMSDRTSSPPPINAASHPDAISSQAATHCNTANLMTAEGVKDCRTFCDPALCCFAAKGDSLSVFSIGDGNAIVDAIIDGCQSTDTSAWCSQYTACGSLLHINDEQGFGSDEDATAAVEAACADITSEACKTICHPGECCFVDESYCGNTGMADVQCGHYQACYGLYDAATGSSAQEVLIPRPPEDLESTCEVANDDDPQASQKCADACSPAKCCVSDIETCKVVNPTMCSAYEVHCGEAWGVGYHEATIPEPPSDLELKCAGTSIVDDTSTWEACDDACRPARCCDEDITVCKVTNPDLCLAYEVHCAAVWGDLPDEVNIPEAPIDLDRQCAGAMLSADRRKSCTDACRPASCCDEDISSCRVLNPNACTPYSVHCALVWADAYEEVMVPAAPDELSEICRIGGGDYERCSDLCYQAKCCDQEIEACKVLNPGACDAYDNPCAGFWGDSVTILDAPDELRQVCTVDNVLTLDGHNRCQDLCSEARCCYADPAEKCRVLNPEVCSGYDPCTALYQQSPESAIASRENGGIEVPPAPAGLDALCSPDSLSDVHGFTDCEDRCNRARCCLEDETDCNVLNREVCPDYEEPCTNLYNFKTRGSILQPDDRDNVDIMDLAEQVVDACSSQSLRDTQGRSHCEHLCNDRSCCFLAQTNPDSCSMDSSKECLAFAACNVLHKEGRFSQ